MAHNLAQKYPGLLVFDLDRSRVRSLSPAAVSEATDISGLARRADLVFLSLPASAAVREVVLGEGGLAASLRPGSIIVDTSTTETSVVRELSAELERRGLFFADAPVSGGEQAARAGTLSFMVGASGKVFEEIRHYLAVMGASVVRMGEVSSGQIAKAVNQMIVGAAFAVIAESFALGVKNGLDPAVLYEAIKGGWAGSPVLDVAVRDLLSREFKPGGTVDIHWKDLGYALALSKDADVPVPVTALVHEIFKASRARGDGKKSQPAVVRLWESLLGLELASS
jgi:2-hydroxy-3-oxopropionate reductase